MAINTRSMNALSKWVTSVFHGFSSGPGRTRTHQARGASPSGFLGDYAALRQGPGGQAQLLYINPDTDFKGYSKVLLDTVILWAPEASRLSRLAPKDSEKLRTHLETALRAHLSAAFTVVDQPEPGTMRIRVAITEACRSNPVMDLFTNLLPIGWVMTAAQRILLGTHAFVGKASLEGEAVDAVTGERLLAAVDRRAGRKILRGKFSSWDDVISAQDDWAERIRKRLTDLCQCKEGHPGND